MRQVAVARRPPSRAEISAATGLTRATVSALVDELIAGRLLSESAPVPRTGAGRPATGLTLAPYGPAGLGLEINVDYLAACVVDLTGAVRHREVLRADQRPHSPVEVLARLGTLAESVLAAPEVTGLPIAGAAIAVPGLVTRDGVVRLAPNLGWHDVDVPGALTATGAALAGIPLTVDNEANLAALGELHARSGDLADFVYVSGEIGVGAGIVLDGRLFRGARGWSGELGHMAVRPDGPTCRCGARGCLEQYAGQEAILRTAGLAGQQLPPAVALQQIAQLAAAQQPVRQALDAAAGALGVVLAGVVNLLDVETVVLGGIYAPLAAWLAPTVQAEINRRVLTVGWSPVTVRASVLGGEAAATGAAGAVVRAVRDHPSPWLTLP